MDSENKNNKNTDDICLQYEDSFFEGRAGSESDSEREAVMVESGAVAGRTRSAFKPPTDKLWRKRPVESTLSDSESVRSSGSKRGRGKSATLDKKNLSRQPVVNLSRNLRKEDPSGCDSGKSGLEGDSSSDDERSADALLAEGLKCAEAVKSIAIKSSNIKGDLRRDLKVAATAFKKITKVLSRRTCNQEVRRLQADNNRLQREMEDLRKEVSSLKEGNKGTPSKLTEGTPKQSLVPTELPLEELQRAIMVSVGTMLNARLEALEDRLLPSKTVRPPLGKRVVPTEVATSRTPNLNGKSGSSPAVKNPTANKKSKKSKKDDKLSRETPDTNTTSWATVVKRGKKKPSTQPPSIPFVPAVPQKKKNNTAKKTRKVRPPRSSAVVLTLQPGAEKAGHSYNSVISEAKKVIGNLSDLGIAGGVRCRKAATGARVLEILGAATGSQADTLAGKIREVIPPEFLKVDRPVKSANLRITGLDDSVSPSDVSAAVANIGGCPEGQIKIGVMQTNASGTGSVRVTCPIAVANKLAGTGRLLVGWSSARVILLEPRPRRCFRCLEVGHVGVKCTSTTDRSGECYRCGAQGHKAAACSASPRCSLCASEGKKADHRVGAKTCAHLKKRKVKKPNTVATAHSVASESEKVMVVE